MTIDCTKINLKKGSKGDTVRELQTILQKKGYYTGKLDGDFGKYTEDAVKKLQKEQGNSTDGVFGPKTCKKYMERTKKKESTKDQLIKEGKIIPVLEKVSGIKITDYKSLYKAYASVKYSYYYNDVYTFKQELERILEGKGLNCTDEAQSANKGLEELGFDSKKKRIVRGVVTCNSGKGFGHVWLQIFVDGKWINFDPSAISAHGYGLGKLICTKAYKITNINPSWAVSDDGKT